LNFSTKIPGARLKRQFGGRFQDQGSLASLLAENPRLVALLEAHGIEWRQLPKPFPPTIAEPEPSKLSTAE
jgi:hypothetical protein